MSVISDFVDTLRSLTETDVMCVLSSSVFLMHAAEAMTAVGFGFVL